MKNDKEKEVSPADHLRALAEMGLAMSAAKELLRHAMKMQDDVQSYPDPLVNATMVGVAAGARVLSELLVHGCGDPNCHHLDAGAGGSVDIIVRRLREEMEALKNARDESAN